MHYLLNKLKSEDGWSGSNLAWNEDKLALISGQFSSFDSSAKVKVLLSFIGMTPRTISQVSALLNNLALFMLNCYPRLSLSGYVHISCAQKGGLLEMMHACNMYQRTCTCVHVRAQNVAIRVCELRIFMCMMTIINVLHNSLIGTCTVLE